MSKEQRAIFEAALQTHLRERLTAPVALKVTKNKVSLSVESDRSRAGFLALAYPIPMIACAISANAIDPRDYADRVLIKRLLKNKAYDSSVLLGT